MCDNSHFNLGRLNNICGALKFWMLTGAHNAKNFVRMKRREIARGANVESVVVSVREREREKTHSRSRFLA